MSNEIKNKVVPKLRFPEFRESEGWEELSLGKIAEIITGNTPNTSDSSNYRGSRLFVSPSDISEGRYVTQTKTTLSEKGYSHTRHIKENSVLFVCIGSTIGKIGQNKYECSTNQQINSLVPYEGHSSDFLYSALEFKASSIATIAGKHAVPIINKSLFSSVLVSFPPLEEQQKIADCLSSLDELITAQSQKLQALKTHKKGLMQQLFPAEGETVPKLRFAEFRNSGEWEEKTLGSVCKSFSGGTPSTTQREYYGGNIPFIRSAEIDKYTTELFLTSEGLNNSSAKLVNQGDILVALYGANSGDVALAKIAGAINQAILCLKSQESNSFIYQFLLFKKDWIVSTYIQGGQGNLSGDIVKSIKLLFPKPEEQQKIADCLSSLDEQISAQTEKIEALKTHKKGLMQALFPSEL